MLGIAIGLASGFFLVFIIIGLYCMRQKNRKLQKIKAINYEEEIVKHNSPVKQEDQNISEFKDRGIEPSFMTVAPLCKENYSTQVT